MRILVCGADGFLGGHVVAALRRRGHEVVRGVHRPRLPGDIAIDYRDEIEPVPWRSHLAGIDAVVNAVGILREGRPGDFESVHHRAPAALFRACAEAGIGRVVQVSALGRGATPYLTSKHAADAALWRTLPEGVAVRPGLIYGRDGASTRFFLALASLPVQALPLGAGPVQPVHVDDVVECIVRLVEGAPVANGWLDLPGPERLAYADWLAGYRAGLGLAPALRLPLPGMAMLAWLAGLVPGSLLSRETWAMLRAGNTGDPAPAAALLGRPLVAPAAFIAEAEREPLRLRALADWRGPTARGVLAAIWLGTALVSAGLFAVDASLTRLAPFGLSGGAALVVLAGATALDAVMAYMTLFHPGRRLWQGQLALVLVYTLLVAWRLPAFLVDPFGPILKNLAVMALLVQLWSEEKAK